MRIFKLHFVSIVTLAIVVFITIFGLNLTIDSHRGMIGCPYMDNVASLCPMDWIEHFAYWQSFFQALPIYFYFLMLGVMLINAFSLFTLLLLIHNHSPSKRFQYQSFKNSHWSYCNYLHYIFSQGILHPKLF